MGEGEWRRGGGEKCSIYFVQDCNFVFSRGFRLACCEIQKTRYDDLLHMRSLSLDKIENVFLQLSRLLIGQQTWLLVDSSLDRVRSGYDCGSCSHTSLYRGSDCVTVSHATSRLQRTMKPFHGCPRLLTWDGCRGSTVHVDVYS